MEEVVRDQRGRPAVTTHGEIEQAAFRLFAEHGFEATTIEMIAAQLSIGRRTVSRYYPSKNDIPWGQFDLHLTNFARLLDEQPTAQPLWRAIHSAVLAFNDFPADASPPHRERMALIRNTPALVAHSSLRYHAWRQVIAEYVARREALDPGDPRPRTVAHLSLAVVLSAYDLWLEDPGRNLLTTIDESMTHARSYLCDGL
jgi:mycofactocin system transcriptional regulator